ncbi:DUF4251 domain-containing protein [Seonamhaeicola maritimus]|uniref:DUF4251 domain-containing protein n=1 Tax=Seonamhaeicola maritimus TaxID=2591822 RepID=A0A5C7GN41_9FLAO|nr:DUF4251 domain-containing protein [Seonamhaeicola maritimus]TXG39723.1 DUF4251 domain-containing protein [Seonamhaeicola maritimus]
MRTQILTILVLALIFVNCGSGKQVVKAEALEKLNAIVKMDNITIESDQANPQNALLMANTGLLPVGSTGGSINLIGNPNHLKIMGNSLSIDLPFYGEMRMGGGYNTDNAGINFEGIPDVFEHSFNSKKSTQNYYFEVKNENEAFQINLSIYPSLRTEIRVNSSHRTFISYRGQVIEKKE